MFADRVNEGERDGAEEEEEEEEEEGASERSERSLLSPPAARNRVSGDGHLALAGCSGKWPSNVTTNGHCWRTDRGREGLRERGREHKRWESVRQCNARGVDGGKESGASFFFLRESAGRGAGITGRARGVNPRLRGAARVWRKTSSPKLK